jgi:hypothetical protein
MQVDADPSVCDPDGPGNRENQAEVAKAMHPAHRSIANRSYRHGIRLHFCTFQAGDKDCRFGTVCSHSAARRRGVSPVRNNCSDFCGETGVVRQGGREPTWVHVDPRCSGGRCHCWRLRCAATESSARAPSSHPQPLERVLSSQVHFFSHQVKATPSGAIRPGNRPTDATAGRSRHHLEFRGRSQHRRPMVSRRHDS